MRHRNSGRKLLLNGRIKTTLQKAKDMRRVVEPLITLGKRNDLAARRLAYKVLNNHNLVKHLFDKIAPLFQDVNGGYTRIMKLAFKRRGDNADMALIEFVREVPKETLTTLQEKHIEARPSRQKTAEA